MLFEPNKVQFNLLKPFNLKLRLQYNTAIRPLKLEAHIKYFIQLLS